MTNMLMTLVVYNLFKQIIKILDKKKAQIQKNVSLQKLVSLSCRVQLKNV